MYTPAYYKISDLTILTTFIRQHSFGTLIAGSDPFPLATQIPMELMEQDGRFFLNGHVSAANPQGAWFRKAGLPALAIFSAGHSYVSSSWYENENVSTWNYRSVQVSGYLSPLADEPLREHLKRMQAYYEEKQQHPRTVDKMPADFFEKHVRGVSGFTMNVESMQGSWKLSQNRNEKDFENIIEQLEKSGEPGAKEIAEEMKKIRDRKQS